MRPEEVWDGDPPVVDEDLEVRVEAFGRGCRTAVGRARARRPRPVVHAGANDTEGGVSAINPQALTARSRSHAVTSRTLEFNKED